MQDHSKHSYVNDNVSHVCKSGKLIICDIPKPNKRNTQALNVGKILRNHTTHGCKTVVLQHRVEGVSNYDDSALSTYLHSIETSTTYFTNHIPVDLQQYTPHVFTKSIRSHLHGRVPFLLSQQTMHVICTYQ